MKLKTSFFNPTALRKDVTRFAPLWGLYTAFMLLVVMLLWANENEPARFATDAPVIMMAMGVVNFFYAGISALMLFGDLFQSKMAGSLHAMPLRREGWFLVHTAAGFLFCLVPNSLGAVLASMILQEYCYLAFIWLGLMLLQYLFFFGTAAFCIQCAGNKLGAAAVYGLFNLLAVLAAFLVDTFYAPVLYGIETDWEAICSHSPVVGFTMTQYVEVVYDNMYGTARFEGFLPDAWSYLFVAAAVGALLLGASVLLYRKRQLESAGDFIAVKPAAPVFLVIYTLCVGAVLYFLADQMGTDLEYLFLLVGFAIGLFTGFMLLEKKVNVFQGKKWLYLGLITMGFFLTVTVVTLDPLGVTRYVPKATQVEQIRLSPYGSVYYLENEPLILDDVADIQEITDLHKDLVANRTYDDTNMCLRLRYYLKNGTTVERKYYVQSDSREGQILEKYFTRFSCVTGCDTVEEMLNQVVSMEFYSHVNDIPSISMYPTYATQTEPLDTITEEIMVKYEPEEGWAQIAMNTQLLRGLLEAMEKDCKAGNMAQNWDYHPDEETIGSLNFALAQDRYSTRYTDITVYSGCENTVNYLRSLINS